jgi:phosphoglucosamine mutase
MQRVPQVLVNTTLKARRPLENMPVTRALVRTVEKALGAEGRVLVRWSGTEPKLRVMIEGPDEATIQRMAEEIAEAAGKEIG